MKILVIGSLALVVAGSLLMGVDSLIRSTAQNTQAHICFDNPQSYRRCVTVGPAKCDTDTDCMEKFGGDGSPSR